jgi:chromosome segregation ATPase
MPYGFPPLPDTSTSDLAAACEEKDRTIRELKASASRHGELVDRLYRDIKALQASLQQSRKDKEKYKSKYQSLQQDMRARDLTASLLAPQAQQPPAYHQEESGRGGDNDDPEARQSRSLEHQGGSSGRRNPSRGSTGDGSNGLGSGGAILRNYD